MEQLNLQKCESLADVFFAVIGGKTDNIKEIEAYMANSPLKQLLHASDVERVVKYDGFFSDEVVDAVYALLPVKLQIAPNRTWIMTPQAFRKLNAAQISKPASRFICIPNSLALGVYVLNFENKIKRVINAIKGIEEPEKKEEISKNKSPKEKLEDKRAKKRLDDYKRRRKELKKEKAPASPKTTSKSVEKTVLQTVKKEPQNVTPKQTLNKIKNIKDPKKWAKIVSKLKRIRKLCTLKTTSKEELEELKKEANRLKSAKYRLENPDAWKKNYKKVSELPPEKQAKRRAGNNRRNETFRDIHREELRVYHNKRREQEKAENPEAIKEKDKKYNSSTGAKAAKKRYYEKNTQQVIEKACRCNKIKRFKQKTGPAILGLLQGIINSKIK